MSRSERAALLPTLAGALAVGLLIGARWDAPTSATALFALAAALGLWLSASLRISLLPALAALALALGTLRAASADEPGAALIPLHATGKIELAGTIADYPKDAAAASTFTLRAESVRVDDESARAPVSGLVRVTAAATAAIAERRAPPLFRYGDRLILSGRLRAPPELDDFDFPAYLERRGIRSVMSFPNVRLVSEGGGSRFARALHAMRREMADALAKAVPEPQAAFGQAILLGIRDGLPDSLTEDFRRSGASHLLAISGLHVGILLALTVSAGAALFGRRRRLYLLAPFAAVWGYALLSGASPSATRAAVMGTAYLLALVVGRPRSFVPALALAAALMAAAQPRVLSDVSFQLSFAAMMGIALYRERLSDPILDALNAGPEVGGVRAEALRSIAGATGITLAATLATAPLVGFHFGQVSTMSLPATLLALPAVPLTLVAHGAAALIGVVSETASAPAGWLAWALSAYIVKVADILARVPAASIKVGELGAALVWIYYGAAAVFVIAAHVGIWRSRRTSTPTSVRLSGARALAGAAWSHSSWQAVVVVLIAAALIWTAALARRGDAMTVVFADVGQGDMTAIITPSGHRIVVDGGPDTARAAQALGEALPFWARTIDLLILTHPHDDHVAGLNEILRRYRVSNVLSRAPDDFDSAAYAVWRGMVAREGANVVTARPGAAFEFADGVRVETLWPPDALLSGTASDVDNASVAVRIVYGERGFLLTGDLFAEGERRLVESGRALRSDVLKIAHHGSATSSSREMLEAVAPSAAVISAGEDNPFGHPSPEVLERLKEYVPPSRVFVTSERGAITFETDGESLWVRTER